MYRVYRKIGKIEYRDVEAESLEEAEKNYYTTASDQSWICISDGLILEHIATEDTSKENHNIFIERQMRLDKEWLEEDKNERDRAIFEAESKLQ